MVGKSVGQQASDPCLVRKEEVLSFPRATVARPGPCQGGLTGLLFPPPPPLSLSRCLESARRLGASLPLPAGLWVTRTHAVTVTVSFPRQPQLSPVHLSNDSRKVTLCFSSGTGFLAVPGSCSRQLGPGPGLSTTRAKTRALRVLQTLPVAPRRAGHRCPWHLRTSLARSLLLLSLFYLEAEVVEDGVGVGSERP